MILIVSLISFAFKELIGYKVVALLLLMVVSLIAMLFEIFPVLLAALLSSLIWNFFFIPPIFTFHIDSTEDVMLFFLYFFVAFVNTVLSFKIRKEEKKAREKEEKLKQIAFYNTLLNSLSHELRTPISTIIGAVDMLRESNDRLSPQQSTELLLQIDHAGMNLNRHVENLLNMSRLESGILSTALDWCDTNELIHTVLNEFSAFKTHTLIFIPDEELPLLKVDEGLMQQVIHNLIHNSVLYTPEKSTIEVTSNFNNHKWCLQISDDGNGIPNANIEAVFDKFYRVPDTRTGGSGLGLSIVKGFVEMHGGVVSAKNNPTKGITFCVKIPAEASFINNLKNE